MRAAKRSTSAAAACQQPEATASAVLSASSTISPGRSGRTRAVRVQQRLLHQPRTGRDQAAQVLPVASQRIQRERGADTGQHARRVAIGMRRDHRQETIHAQPLRLGIRVAHAAGAGRRAQPVGVPREQALRPRAATWVSRATSTTEARDHPRRRRQAAQAARAAPPISSCQSTAPRASQPSGCACSAHFSRVLPRSAAASCAAHRDVRAVDPAHAAVGHAHLQRATRIHAGAHALERAQCAAQTAAAGRASRSCRA